MVVTKNLHIKDSSYILSLFAFIFSYTFIFVIRIETILADEILFKFMSYSYIGSDMHLFEGLI